MLSSCDEAFLAGVCGLGSVQLVGLSSINWAWREVNASQSISGAD